MIVPARLLIHEAPQVVPALAVLVQVERWAVERWEAAVVATTRLTVRKPTGEGAYLSYIRLYSNA